MTKKEAMRRTMQDDTLRALGFTQDEAESLRRISMTLQRWHELECGVEGGCVERDENTGKCYWLNSYSGRRSPVADRETGALKRLAGILAARNARKGIAADWRNYRCDNGTFDIVDANGDIVRQNLPAESAALSSYIQTDPRGAALYVLRPGDVPAGEDAGAYYSRGICVY